MSQYRVLKNLIDYCVSENAHGVEIGVDQAHTSVHMLTFGKKLGHLYCVDPYFDRDRRYNVVKGMLSQYDNCTLMRMTSHAAAIEVPGDLDFVFIDGDHSYEAVIQDLYDWVPKLKSGGLLVGHDWCYRHVGIPKAGSEYFSKFGDLFISLIPNEKMKVMGLPFHIGGQGFVQKQNAEMYPLWWRIKK